MSSPDNPHYPLTVGGLCSGIGGLELGLERAGMRTIWQAETDPYASKVLAKHWPDVPNLGDITTIDWSDVDRPDIICAGFPCQPFSTAGIRLGADDPRHLWPHVARCLRLVRPRWVLLENVPGLLTLGFGEVAGDLAAIGYDLEWECIPAAAVGAPHLRWRIFVVAHTDRQGSQGRQLLPERASQRAARPSGLAHPSGGGDRAEIVGCEAPRPDAFGSTGWPRRSGWWESEPDVGRVAHGVPARVDRLRCLGNAVVPQVAEWVGRRIVEADCAA
jgi:DNA (cytosine-5)-methyltransferase 1